MLWSGKYVRCPLLAELCAGINGVVAASTVGCLEGACRIRSEEKLRRNSSKMSEALQG